MPACIKVIEEAWFVRGFASPCAFWHAGREIEYMGTTSAMLGHAEQLDGSGGRSRGDLNLNAEEDLDPLRTMRRR